MSRYAIERALLRLLQRGGGSRFFLGLSLCLRERDDGLWAYGPRWRRTRDTQRRGARHARGDRWGRRGGHGDGRRALVPGDVQEHLLMGLLGGWCAGPTRALEPGRAHACAEIGGAGGAWDDGRGVVGERYFTGLEGGAPRGAVGRGAASS